MSQNLFAATFQAIVGCRFYALGLMLACALAVALPAGAFTATAQGTTLSLNFGSAVPGTIQDGSGNGTGFSTRLPNTGTSLSNPDTNLSLNTVTHTLTVSPNPAADFNGGPINTMEALGVNLSSLGFNGSQDFSVSASFSYPSAAGQDFNQFGVYVGASGTVLTRDGFVNVNILGGQKSYSANDNGSGDFSTTFASRTFVSGDQIVTTISRTGGVFTETVADTTQGFSDVVTPASLPGAYLNAFSNLNGGIYATETSGALFSLPVTSFTATVVPEPSSIVLVCVAAAGLLLAGRRRFCNRLSG
jgi:hypothetical protein